MFWQLSSSITPVKIEILIVQLVKKSSRKNVMALDVRMIIISGGSFYSANVKNGWKHNALS